MNLSPKKKADMDAKWQKIASKAVTQEQFKQKLLKDTLGTLKDHGLELPESVKVSVAVNKDISIGLPDNCDEALKEEVKWWRWRIAAIKEFGHELKKNTEDVGDRFVEEARSIYIGESDKRAIRGTTSEEEASDLEEEGVPLELFYLAMIESGLNPIAMSYAKAAGYWQFIASTGKNYGLKKNWWIDERSDFEKSGLGNNRIPPTKPIIVEIMAFFSLNDFE